MIKEYVMGAGLVGLILFTEALYGVIRVTKKRRVFLKFWGAAMTSEIICTHCGSDEGYLASRDGYITNDNLCPKCDLEHRSCLHNMSPCEDNCPMKINSSCDIYIGDSSPQNRCPLCGQNLVYIDGAESHDCPNYTSAPRTVPSPAIAEGDNDEPSVSFADAIKALCEMKGWGKHLSSEVPSAGGAEVVNTSEIYVSNVPDDGSIWNTRPDPVNNPPHYTSGVIETIDAIEAWGLDKDHYLANAIKYISRAGKKDKDTFNQDIEKAIWYLKRRIRVYGETGNVDGK